MRKGQVIKGYTVQQDFSTKGGSMSKWTFVSKGSSTYFMKEYLTPKYPQPEAPGSEAVKKRKLERCKRFEKHQMDLINAVRSKVSLGGNLVFPVDFFRSGASYYKVSEKIDVASIRLGEISSLKVEDRILVMKTATHSVMILHDLGIVHGDLKPDNILIKKTATGKFATKLIDFDNSYFEGNPPADVDDLVGDQSYYSPEMLAYVKEPGPETKRCLTTKSDIFALGIIFHQYAVGKIPPFDTKLFTYTVDAVMKGGLGELLESLKDFPQAFANLLLAMLDHDPNNRPTSGDVLKVLRSIDGSGVPEIPVPATPGSAPIAEAPTGSRLRGRILAKRKPDEPAAAPPPPTAPEPAGSGSSRLRGKLLKRS